MFFGLISSGMLHAEGKRPYEMDWANRFEDEVPPLVDFEAPFEDAWYIETTESTAAFERSNEQKIWGDFVGKLTYRCASEKPAAAPNVKILLRTPVPVSKLKNAETLDFDAISCWIYGNNWSWVPDSSTPAVSVAALFKSEDGKRYEYPLAYVNWREWFLPFLRLTPEQTACLNQPGTCFEGFSVSGGRNVEDRVLYFDNLAVRRDTLSEPAKELEFSERPKRGIVVPEQNQGVNTGAGVLPFPTRPETILPDCAGNYENYTEEKDSRFTFTCAAQDGTLECVYAPTADDSAPWDALTLSWEGANAFHPLQNGGVKQVVTPDSHQILPVLRHEFVSAKKVGNTVETQWNAVAADVSSDASTAASTAASPDASTAVSTQKEFRVPVKYTLQMLGKSLILETRSVGGTVADVAFGSLCVGDVRSAKLVPIPYYTYGYSGHDRPEAVVFQDSAEQTLFLLGSTDWYLGNGSELYAQSRLERGGAFFNGGVRYNAKTDGSRNDCFERFFLTVSPEFEEVLPTIPNPKSPWISVMGTRQWIAHGAGDRQKDCEYWYNIHRYGMTEALILDHEVEWRDGGESFTFRTRTAPGKGGDEGQKMYSDFMNRKLGFYYGPYNNFTDFAPVNEYWSVDMVSRDTKSQLMKAWPRCYAPKPTRGVEFCEKLTPINQKKFNFRCAYCDVHTAVSPWSRVDYDARVPGAGTYAATFYAYGEIMLLQKKGWNGPVYSEGPMHYLYLGVNDGSYAQDQGYNIPENPWLVDFDLLKMHSLGCGFGMGNPSMFYPGRNSFAGLTDAQKTERMDRFFAATLAFGHPGFLSVQSGIQTTWRGYFNLLALHSRYTQVPPESIRYCGPDGKLYTTSEALAADVYKRSQVVVKYTDGTVVCANGSTSEPMKTTVDGREIELVPTAYTGWSPLEESDFSEIYTYSGLQDGTRCDYAVSPDYIFLDGRDSFQKFPLACGSGAGVCRKVDENHWEIITLSDAQMGFRIPKKSVKPAAAALAHDGSKIGKAEVFQSRGYFYVKPVKDAFSYVVETVSESESGAASDSNSASEAVNDVLSCVRFRVFPGETLSIAGPGGAHSYTVPENAADGTRLWFDTEGGRIDFLVSPICRTEIESESLTEISLRLTPVLDPENTPSDVLRVRFCGKEFTPENFVVRLPLEVPTAEKTEFYRLEITDGTHTQPVVLRSRMEQNYVSSPFDIRSGKTWMQMRGQEMTEDFGTSCGIVSYSVENPCGDVSRTGFFTHPPYKNGSGRVGIDYTFDLPAELPLQFRALVGKKDGSDVGDGIYYKIALVSKDGSEQILAEEHVEKHEWKPISCDLSREKGTRVTLRLVTDCGPANNTAGDWGLWGDLELVSAEKQWNRHTEISDSEICKIEAASETRAVTLNVLHTVSKAWLCYSAKGLGGNTPDHPTSAKLNGVPLGNLIGAAGDEQNGIFSSEVRFPLPAEAIAALETENVLEILNRSGDCFSIRAFRIVVELPDGTRLSSFLSPATYTQPGGWKYSEGIKLPENAEFLVPISFER